MLGAFAETKPADAHGFILPAYCQCLRCEVLFECIGSLGRNSRRAKARNRSRAPHVPEPTNHPGSVTLAKMQVHTGDRAVLATSHESRAKQGGGRGEMRKRGCGSSLRQEKRGGKSMIWCGSQRCWNARLLLVWCRGKASAK